MNLESLDYVEHKYHDLILIAKEYMKSIDDFEHNLSHMNDVVMYTKELLCHIDEKIDVDACIISSYWHDVGRIKINEGHEKLSAEMLKMEMMKHGYSDYLIDKCYMAIINHKWNMHPNTIEGLIIKDADKLAWIGLERWKECLSNHQELNSIIELLPKLRNEILYFDESKKIFDRDIIKLIELLYYRINNEVKK